MHQHKNKILVSTLVGIIGIALGIWGCLCSGSEIHSLYNYNPILGITGWGLLGFLGGFVTTFIFVSIFTKIK